MRGRSEAEPQAWEFNPDRVAHFEKAGWEAYYDRRWLRVLWLMVQLNREQFTMKLPEAIAASLDIVAASRAFAPVDSDVSLAAKRLERYYDRAGRSAGLRASTTALAALEMDYWVVHRRLAVARRNDPDHDGDIQAMVEALARLHAALFEAPPEAIRRSAQERAQAAVIVDRITGRYSRDVADDWRRVEAHLCLAY